MPNVADVWDDVSIDENPSGYADAIRRQQALVGREIDNLAVIRVRRDDEMSALWTTAPETPSRSADASPASRGGACAIRTLLAGHEAGDDRWTEILDAWDEYTLEENPDGFAERLQAAHERNIGADLTWVRVIDVYVPESVILDAIAPWRNVHDVAAAAV